MKLSGEEQGAGMATVVTVEGMTASVGGSDIPYLIEEGEVPQSATNSSLGQQHYLCITADHAILYSMKFLCGTKFHFSRLSYV